MESDEESDGKSRRLLGHNDDKGDEKHPKLLRQLSRGVWISSSIHNNNFSFSILIPLNPCHTVLSIWVQFQLHLRFEVYSI